MKDENKLKDNVKLPVETTQTEKKNIKHETK